jgi:type VI secretion system secreted protein Hcp
MDVIIVDAGDKIKGESTLTDFTNKIEALSFSHGVAQQITGDQSNQKRTSGKPNHQDFTVTKYLDLATCNLIDACNTATPLPTVKIIIGQNENNKVNQYLMFTLTNALISSISMGGGGGGKPQETVTFNYTAITWTYKPQQATADASGNNSANWNLATNSNASAAKT